MALAELRQRIAMRFRARPAFRSSDPSALGYAMPSLKPGQLRIEIFAKPSDLGGWPASWFVIFEGSVDEAKMAAKSALDLGIWPLAESFEITDHESQIQYKWPETGE